MLQPVSEITVVFSDTPSTAQTFPCLTREAVARPDLGEVIRIFSFGNYVIICRPIDDGIDVLRVIEGHREFPALFGPKP